MALALPSVGEVQGPEDEPGHPGSTSGSSSSTHLTAFLFSFVSMALSVVHLSGV